VTTVGGRRVYRAGIIGDTGRGSYGHGLDLAFAGLPGVAVVALADPDAAGRAGAVRRTGAERGYADYREMLAREGLDLVAVAPHWLDERVAQVVAAARSGVRGILVEKPFARSLDEADRMLAACDARGVQVAVAHQNRAFPAPRLAGRLLAEGRIGRLRAMRAWSKHDERGGGLELLIHGTHMFDLMRLFAGEARWCHARITVDGRDAVAGDAEPAAYGGGWVAGDDVTATFGFPAGVGGAFESVRAADGGGNDYFRLELCGTAGVLTFWSSATRRQVFHYPAPVVRPDRPDAWRALEAPLEAPLEVPLAELPAEPPVQGGAGGERGWQGAAPAGAGPMHPANQILARSLLAAVEGRGAPLSSGHDGRAALEMIQAVYESHLAGGRVALPLLRRAHPLFPSPGLAGGEAADGAARREGSRSMKALREESVP
jgi:predicted dehydrogenase